MFILFKVIETSDGQLETVVHASYDRKSDAEQVGDNLRLLYPWVKSVRVEMAEAGDPVALPRKKMAASKLREPEPQRKIS